MYSPEVSHSLYIVTCIHDCHRPGLCCPLACTNIVRFTSQKPFPLKGRLPNPSSYLFVADLSKVLANSVVLEWYMNTFGEL